MCLVSQFGVSDGPLARTQQLSDGLSDVVRRASDLASGEMNNAPAPSAQGFISAGVAGVVVPLPAVALDDQTLIGKGEVRPEGTDTVLGEWGEAEGPKRAKEDLLDRGHGRQPGAT